MQDGATALVSANAELPQACTNSAAVMQRDAGPHKVHGYVNVLFTLTLYFVQKLGGLLHRTSHAGV